VDPIHGSPELLRPELVKDGPNFFFRINAESSKSVQEPQPQKIPFLFQ